MSILIKGIPLGGYEISIMKDGERYRARVDGIWCEVEEIQTTEPDADTISRAKAIDAVKRLSLGETDAMRLAMRIGDYLERLSPAQLGANLAEVGTDCISRQAVLDALNNIEIPRNASWYQYYQQALTAVDKLPPAQPEPKRGKWIYHIYDLFPAKSTMECNQCHAEQPLTCDDEFCPHCGAKMEATE